MMKIIIEQRELEEPEVIIRGRADSDEVRELFDLLGRVREIYQFPLYAGEKEYFFKPEEIISFQAEGNHIRALTDSGAYEAKGRLYEIAGKLRSRKFVQISKSTIVNVARVAYVEVEFSGNYVAFLRDGKTKFIITRKYMKDFRKYIMEGK